MESCNYYLLIGKEENWKTSLSKQIWGFTKRGTNSWAKLEVNDLLMFYVTRPTKKVIGFGKINTKFQTNEFVWDLEKYHQEVIWPNKISFEVIFLCENWDEGIPLPSDMILQTASKKISLDLFYDLAKKAESKWDVEIVEHLKTISN